MVNLTARIHFPYDVLELSSFKRDLATPECGNPDDLRSSGEGATFAYGLDCLPCLDREGNAVASWACVVGLCEFDLRLEGADEVFWGESVESDGIFGRE